MLTRRQVKVNDRSARPLRRTVVLHSLRDEQKSWYLHPNAGRATPQQAPTQHLEVELCQLGRVSAVQGHRHEPHIAGGLLTHSSRNDARTTEAPARSAARTRRWLD